MILGANRPAVIENIRTAAECGDFFAKVEPDDPILTKEACQVITERCLHREDTLTGRIKVRAARGFANLGSAVLNRHTEVRVNGDLSALRHGCFLTSNHFNPLENTIIRDFVRKNGKKKLHVISQMCNFAMKGPLGFLLNYADTIPLWEDPRYLNGEFLDVLGGLLKQDEAILIYPEQEMWFNYRKPRPLKRGAYYFAAKLNTPVVCCFVQMEDLPKKDTDEFRKVRYTLHVLDTLYPDSEKSVRQNSFEMCKRDLELKKAAYEAAYQKELSYDFSSHDIAGWIQ